jgi:hypothetical protein
MFTELFLKKVKSLFARNAFHVMIKLQNNLSSLPPAYITVFFILIIDGEKVNPFLPFPFFLFNNRSYNHNL